MKSNRALKKSQALRAGSSGMTTSKAKGKAKAKAKAKAKCGGSSLRSE
jgi:hypothetical protein